MTNKAHVLRRLFLAALLLFALQARGADVVSVTIQGPAVVDSQTTVIA